MLKHPAFLSKSKYIDGLLCPKLLWYEYNRKNKISPPSAELQEAMKQGTIVGKSAQKLFSDGIKIERDFDPVKMNEKSFRELNKRKPLFEAGFTYKNAYALADILVPVDGDAWELIEVKSSTSVKEDHLYDVAFQKYVYEGRGIKIQKCYIMHIDKGYVRKGELELDKLFRKEDVTTDVDRLVPEVEKNIESLIKMISGKEPDIKIGPQCVDRCNLKDFCWRFLPNENIFILRGNRKVVFDLLEQDILKIKDIPNNYDLNGKQSIQVQSHKANKAYIDKESLRYFLGELKYPLYFLDFETIGPAVPIYDLSRPYEEIPFQFSLHVVKNRGSKPEHYSYLAPGDADPRPEILKQLRELLGNSGSIIAYFAKYEKDRLEDAARAHPEFKDWVKKTSNRFVDLLVPFKNFFYYNPAQQGSASMKYVLPALTGITYNDLEIKAGGMARFEYMRVTFGGKAEQEDRQRVRNALEKYCALDTRGMIEILNALEKASK
jgi:CRISPR/Cas system-associated exonuclease Cas4 (RecB family)